MAARSTSPPSSILAHHRAVAVGDEPLLLAREALTVISRRRVEGARRLVKEGADLIIMDDGFQSARLAIDYALLVIDATRGLGNGHIVPGGPVRAPIRLQLRYATALLKVGNGGTAADKIVRIAARAAKPYFTASCEVAMAPISGRKVLAFAGIADPVEILPHRRMAGRRRDRRRRSFGDHEHLTDDEIDDILEMPPSDDLQIVTTSKDFVRLAGHHGKAEELARRCRVIEVEMAFADHAGAQDHRYGDRQFPPAADPGRKCRARRKRREGLTAALVRQHAGALVGFERRGVGIGSCRATLQ
jgi:tetraacyldisaccharide 4'-kinase